jgi:hypothetical protein
MQTDYGGDAIVAELDPLRRLPTGQLGAPSIGDDRGDRLEYGAPHDSPHDFADGGRWIQSPTTDVNLGALGIALLP